MKPKVVFTGGHHNSALVIAKELKKAGKKVYWFGHKFASHGDKSVSAEYQEVVAADIPFFELKTGKFYRQKNPFEYLKIAFGFLQAFFYLVRLRPDLIVSFGGYLSVPTVIVGRLLGIKSITHEQTVTAGWANKAISRFVEKIMLTHKSSQVNYPQGKSVVVGLPLRLELFDKSLKTDFQPKLIYISCGKQGSQLVNRAVFEAIPELVKSYTVIHQTGSNTVTKDLDKARRLKDSLGKYTSHYRYAPYFFAKDAATYLQSAAVVISRAGAHLTYELISLHKRAIFVPISWVSHNEQFLNAKLASGFIPSLVLNENELNKEVIINAIKRVENLKTPKNKVKLETNATAKILKIIDAYLPNQV